jgi:ribose transport system permease protein
MKIAKFNIQHPEKYASLIALVILVIISAFSSQYFLKIENLINILRQVSYTGIIALGMTFIIIGGGIDLSVGSMLAFVGAMTIMTINALGDSTSTIFLAILAAVLIGSLAGSFNGLMITKGKIAPFITTLGTMAIFRSLTLYIGDAGEFRSSSVLFGNFGMQSVLGLPIPVIAFLLLAFILSLVLNRTGYGRHLCAIGANERVALYAAINIDRVRMLSYSITGFCVGVSSLLVASRFNSVSSSNVGVNFELDAITAVIIGGTPMTGGRGSIWFTVIGAIMLGIINNMLNMLGVSAYLQGTVKGLVIIIAVLIQRRS